MRLNCNKNIHYFHISVYSIILSLSLQAVSFLCHFGSLPWSQRYTRVGYVRTYANTKVMFTDLVTNDWAQKCFHVMIPHNRTRHHRNVLKRSSHLAVCCAELERASPLMCSMTINGYVIVSGSYGRNGTKTNQRKKLQNGTRLITCVNRELLGTHGLAIDWDYSRPPFSAPLKPPKSGVEKSPF